MKHLECKGESGQPDNGPRVGFVWCSKHQELHPIPQLTVEREHSNKSRLY